jgi:hypothetical protein
MSEPSKNPSENPTCYTESLDTIIVTIEGPGDTTVRPRRPNVPVDPFPPRRPPLPERPENGEKSPPT